MFKKLVLSSMTLLVLTPIIASVSSQASVSASTQNVTKSSDSNSLLKKLPLSSKSFEDEFPYVLCNVPLSHGKSAVRAIPDGNLVINGKLYAPDRHFVPGDTIRVDLQGVHGAVYYLNKLVKDGDIIEIPKDTSEIEFHYKFSNYGMIIKLQSYNSSALSH